MAKKHWLVTLLKSLFTCDSHTKANKAETKGWRWFLDKFKLKQLTASTTSTCEQKSLSEAKEEQRKQALNVAKATAAAAEAAMVAAKAAVEVVRLTSVSRLPGKHVWNFAAIKIQAAFRAYLARKALRALKGVVRIQALARGRAVRRQLSKQVNHSQLNHSRSCEFDEINQLARMTMSHEVVERSKVECKSSRRQWTGSLFSKEELRSIYLKKHEAAFRRDRMRQYSFSHRERQCCDILDETVPLRIRKKWEEEKTRQCNNTTGKCELGGTMHMRIRPRNLFKEDSSEEVISSPSSSYPRRSFSDMRRRHKPNVLDEEDFPMYMACTESAKAKMRSMSTPRLRLGYETPYSTSLTRWSSSVAASNTTTTSLW